MSIDKAVDSAQLNADLTSVANAIRTKGGTSAQLAFPAGFVQAIGDIETGSGGYTLQQLANDCFLNAEIVLPNDVTSVSDYAFYGKGLSSVTGANVTSIGQNSFASGRTNVNFSFDFSNLEYAGVRAFNNQIFKNETVNVYAYTCRSSLFEGANGMPTIKYKRAMLIDADQVYRVGSVTTIIINSTPSSLSNNAFRRADALADIYVPWAEGAVNGAPWGATNATIHYDTVFDANGDPT